LTKVTENMCTEMRQLYNAPDSVHTYGTLARMFRVSHPTVKRALDPSEAERSYRLASGDETARVRRRRRTAAQMAACRKEVDEFVHGSREDHTRDLHPDPTTDLVESKGFKGSTRVVSDGLPSDGPRISILCDPLLERLVSVHGQPREDIAKELLKHQMRYA
jgi:hypothetical protein